MNQLTTIAQHISSMLGDDGQTFESADGRTLEDLAIEMGADVTYSTRVYTDDGELTYRDGWSGDHIAGDPVRYQFPDGSVIVVAGDCWDYEGRERFSLAQ